ncbi:Integrin Beta-1 [Manis pentadactyla]|nr:Integrin Beta-1 [Manis pentadactyla]
MRRPEHWGPTGAPLQRPSRRPGTLLWAPPSGRWRTGSACLPRGPPTSAACPARSPALGPFKAGRFRSRPRGGESQEHRAATDSATL